MSALCREIAIDIVNCVSYYLSLEPWCGLGGLWPSGPANWLATLPSLPWSSVVDSLVCKLLLYHIYESAQACLAVQLLP